MIQDIQALVECEDKEVAAKADEICMIHAAYEGGDITKEMYVECLEDAKRTFEIQEGADDMKFKAMLVTGVYGILQVV
jgi:hypothetical protein